MIILYFLLLFLLITLAYTGLSLAPWVPTRKKDFKRILELADLKPSSLFYDLGCGTGSLVFYAQEKYKADSRGLELAWPLFLICKIRQLRKKNKVKFKLKNLFKENLSRADAVYVFGLDFGIKKLKKKFEKELKPGARVITYAFPIIGWQPKKISKPTKNDLTIYLYQII